jgi:iron complex transport system substrate-binding protein
MRRLDRHLLCLCATLLVQLAASGYARADVESLPPARIVSLNQCLDSILVELVPPQRIAAISHYSRDPLRSPIAALARQLPITYETAEEIVALRPDLVLASRHSAIATRNALRRVGIRYEVFDVAFSVADSLAQIRRIAALVGSEAEGATLVAKIERAIAAARLPDGAPRLTAAVYETGGLTAGANTVTDELMQVVGFDNLAARHDIRTHRPIPLELIVAAPPDLLLVGEIPAAAGTQAARIVQHRALRKLPAARHEFPARFMYCSGPTIVEEAAALAAARDAVYAAHRARAAP